jgi:hypothetical protein
LSVIILCRAFARCKELRTPSDKNCHSSVRQVIVRMRSRRLFLIVQQIICTYKSWNPYRFYKLVFLNVSLARALKCISHKSIPLRYIFILSSLLTPSLQNGLLLRKSVYAPHVPDKHNPKQPVRDTDFDINAQSIPNDNNTVVFPQLLTQTNSKS